MAVLVAAALFATRAVATLGNQSALKKMRRLQEPLHQACIDACQGASAFHADLMALPDDGALRQRVDLMCAYQDTVRCMSVGGEGFEGCENIALNQGRPTALDEVECNCNVCTSIIDRVVTVVEELDENEESGAEDRMPLLCQQVGLDACFSDYPEQCLWAIDDLGFHELPTAEECQAEGHPTAQFTDSSGVYRVSLSLIGAAAMAVACLHLST